MFLRPSEGEFCVSVSGRYRLKGSVTMSENKHTADELKQLQSLPLEVKIQKTRLRIAEWIDRFGEDGVYVSFSGGKDSTVLLDIVRKDYPNVEAVFVNTGLEYPSVREFAESKENVTILRPKMNFREVICKYGYPMISKTVSHNVAIARNKPDGNVYKNLFNPNKTGPYAMHRWEFLIHAPFLVTERCCDIIKKSPVLNAYKGKKPILGTMAEESKLRETSWIHNGCNAFDMKKPSSRPLSFWTENDIHTYIHTYNITIADVYGQVVIKGNENGQMNIADINGDYSNCEFQTTGIKRSGCIFCGFGLNQDKQRFIRLSEQEPKLCDYVMRGGAFDTDGMWKPTNDGLGYWFVLEWLNVHGGLNIGIPNRDYYMEKYGNGETEKHLERK